MVNARWSSSSVNFENYKDSTADGNNIDYGKLVITSMPKYQKVMFKMDIKSM